MTEDKKKAFDESDFNSAVATLMRIDNIKKGLILATINSEYLEHYRYLVAYYLELISIMNDEEEEEEIKNFETHLRNERELKDLLEKNPTKIPIKLINWLFKWEMILKNIEQGHGLNMPEKTKSRWSLYFDKGKAPK